MRHERARHGSRAAACLALAAVVLACPACMKEAPGADDARPVPAQEARRVREEPARTRFLRACSPRGEWVDGGYCPKVCGWVDSPEPRCDADERCVDPESARRLARAGQLPVASGCYDTCDSGSCRERYRCVQGEVSVPAGSETFQVAKLCLPEKPPSDAER
ncbi:hypothetical protein HPC49_01335 [Pyxidicoccus fallax]|uniref:Lipoprotein n=1 Tax=Pyxidicoccus fallax TaxID=394095 RepID=A0A848LGM9_9BACT|nr:hypothetical protein [Pyxidicoccus fallax]NMO15198.1 hypothetical protein [Pyxidicoccus fallax]NPC76897.1 hypothetical protein [Pyxidicoccus fallax]